jgi:hypothetical protein
MTDHRELIAQLHALVAADAVAHLAEQTTREVD